MDVRVQWSCGDVSQHWVLYEVLGSGTASRMQNTPPLKDIMQVTLHLKHISSLEHKSPFLFSVITNKSFEQKITLQDSTSIYHTQFQCLFPAAQA